MDINGVALNPIGQKQFIDHLAPLAAGLQIPYLFHEADEEASVKELYPELKTILLPFDEFNPEYLIEHFDCTFLSDQWEKATFDDKFRPLEEAYGKKMRNIHCPHGFSDKGFYLRGVAFEDISLIYGQNMLDLLNEWGVLSNLKQFVICGNYRLAYYKKHQEFYDDLIQKQVKSHFKKNQQTILYAPTCADLEDSTSFFSAAPLLLENLPDDFNMIVKPHPRLELDDPVQYYQIMSRYEDKENILFLKDFSPIYPLLAIVDIYIGDMSSIGYDFLAFDRPMFFLNEQKRNPKEDRGLYLFRCGVEVLPDQYSSIYSLLRQSSQQDLSPIRKEVYSYTFGAALPITKIKQELILVLSQKNN